MDSVARCTHICESIDQPERATTMQSNDHAPPLDAGAMLLIVADYLLVCVTPGASAALRAIVASGATDAIAARECQLLAALHPIERSFIVGAGLSAIRFAEGPQFETTEGTPRDLRALVGAIVLQCSLIDIEFGQQHLAQQPLSPQRDAQPRFAAH